MKDNSLHRIALYVARKIDRPMYLNDPPNPDIGSIGGDIAIQVKYKLSAKQLKKVSFNRDYPNQFIVCHKYTKEALHLATEKGYDVWQFIPDYETMDKYMDNFSLPEWFHWDLKRHHFRFVDFANQWHPQTRDCSGDPSEFIKQQYFTYASRGKHPIRMYYSLSSMGYPKGEFEGKGYPTGKVIPAYDFDIDNHFRGCYSGRNVYCVLCSYWVADLKLKLTDKLTDFNLIHSGQKGVHAYPQLNRKINPTQYLAFSRMYDTDLFLNAQKGMDLHRVMKIPYTVDFSTGVIASENGQQLVFGDQLEPLN